MSLLTEPKEVNASYTGAQDKDDEEVLEEGKPCPRTYWPQVDHLITEDNTPVDNLFSERQRRLLVDSLYVSWDEMKHQRRSFAAMADVGLFYFPSDTPLVPDMLLSLDVTLPENPLEKRHRSYFVWEYGKAPDVVVEIVSNKKGGEDKKKLLLYAQMKITYYVIYDPQEHLKQGILRIYTLNNSQNYKLLDTSWLDLVGLGLTLWAGHYQELTGIWLRWCDKNGKPLLTGAESSEKERQRADKAEVKVEQERLRAEEAEAKAEQERRKVEQLMAQLRKLGIEPK